MNTDRSTCDDLENDDPKRKWARDGFVVARHLFGSAKTNRLQEICEAVLAKWRSSDASTNKPGERNAIRMQHANHPNYHKMDPAGLVDLLAAVGDPQIRLICAEVLESEPLFNCLSLYMTPLEQHRDGFWHRDTQNPYPDPVDERNALEAADPNGLMLQFQIALVASDDLEYVPGSHLRWDTPTEFDIRRANYCRNSNSAHMPNAVRIALQPGDAVLFNAYGIHRGRYHLDRTRLTLMPTYTARQRALEFYHPYFTYQPWFASRHYLAGLDKNTAAFYRSYIATFFPAWLRQDRSVASK